jgi:hypothetical protein
MKGTFLYLITALLTVVVLGCILSWLYPAPTEGFTEKPQAPAFRSESAYQTQVKLLTDRFEPYSTGKRTVQELLEKEPAVPEAERILVNFQTLACRYPGFLGPLPSGYMDPDVGILTAVKAGCRTFVLDIDYIKECRNDATGYFPRLVVRDRQEKLAINVATQEPLCQSPQSFELRTICQKIHDYAFSSSCPQASDPILLILYFHRRPPGSYKSKTVLDYYSHVAKALAPFENRLLTNELEGGKFYRHQQEGKLLMNPITHYNGKVLIFNNANTSGFTETKTYTAMEDLDFLTNLRLYSTQTKLGTTEQATGASFGMLQAMEDFLTIPDDRKEQTQSETTTKWSMALPKDPLAVPTKEQYDTLTATMGVQCVPTLLFLPDSDASSSSSSSSFPSYLFEEKTFKQYGFRYKPEALRQRRPPVVAPGEPNPSMNARQGRIIAPTL